MRELDGSLSVEFPDLPLGSFCGGEGMKTHLIIILVLLVACSGCSDKYEETDIEAEKEAIKKVIHHLYEAFDSGDFDEAEKFLSDEYEFISAGGKRMSWESIRNVLESLGATGFKAEISNMKLKVYKNVAFGAWNQVNTEYKREKIFKSKTVITAIFEKIKSNWMWIHVHETEVKDQS